MSTTISASDWKRLKGGLPAAAPRSKYGNKKVAAFDLDGAPIKFDSKREAKRWSELTLLQKAGTIRDLERQVPFLFATAGKYLTYSSNRKVKYVADFAYTHAGHGERIIEDVKGVRTDAYKIKKALMQLFHGIEIRET